MEGHLLVSVLIADRVPSPRGTDIYFVFMFAACVHRCTGFYTYIHAAVASSLSVIFVWKH